MDKYEYRIRAEEINDLIEKKEYVEAVKIADTIDWRRVRSVVMLCKVSELYKINRRYEDSKEVLLLAYELQNKSRKIIYSLCELSIKLEETVQAVEYYKEFIKIAPRDTGRFILQYRLYEAQDVSLEERIAVLEEYKKRDYREKWAYELAYLYHRIGLATRCVEECDELILWFGEGKYVIKALELKMLHAPLTPEQQEIYNARFMVPVTEVPEEQTEQQEQEEVEPSLSIEIKSVEATRAKTAEIPSKEVNEEVEESDALYQAETEETEENTEEENPDEDRDMKIVNPNEDLDIQVKMIDVGDEYNTINLQDELARNLAEIFAKEDMEASDATKALPIDSIFEAASQNLEEITKEIVPVEEEIEEVEETAPVEEEIEEVEEIAPVEEEIEEIEEIAPVEEEIEEVEEIVPVEEEIEEIEEIAPVEEDVKEVEPIVFNQNQPLPDEFIQAVRNAAIEAAKQAAAQATAEAMKDIRPEVKEEPETVEPENLPESNDGGEPAAEEPEELVEKQITGQLSFSDIMAEWEETKKANEEKHLQEMKQRVMEQTGPLLSDFDAAARASVNSDFDMLSPMLDIFSDTDNLVTEVEDALKEEISEEPKEPETEEIPEEPKEPETEEISEEAQESDEDRPSSFNTEEINGLEEKLMGALSVQHYDTANIQASVLETEMTKEEKTFSPRTLTMEEKELFGEIAPNKEYQEKVAEVLDRASLLPYTNNIIISGEKETGTVRTAENIAKYLASANRSFSGKTKLFSSEEFTGKDIFAIVNELTNGILIIDNAGEMSTDLCNKLIKAGNEMEDGGILYILTDTASGIEKLEKTYEKISEYFNLKIEISALDNDGLVKYGKLYAKEKEYTIDDMGILALYNRIEERQTNEHAVTVDEVKEIVDHAIDRSEKKNLSHFMDVIFAKRYDKDDMIVLREKDFLND